MRNPTHLQLIRGKTPRMRGKAKKVYNSGQWKRLRMRVLGRSPFCAMGCGGLAVHVHHLIDIESGGAAFDEENLQVLCHSCHSKVTAGKLSPLE